MENFASIAVWILIFIMLYFLIIRPQQKQRKDHVSMIASLKKGDKVVTIGGLHGSIVDLSDDSVTLKVNDSSRLVFDRQAIRSKSASEDENKE